ncbi:hypothetical protein MNBD_ALPHA12-235 [hydrothermal vent metagenome]|uniref:Response regulatory domain-containing protein n=1 Tax=hydrothermal vent metagenome TaxID=652676 RepID=A0A3B0TDN0_9ZZZZ
MTASPALGSIIAMMLEQEQQLHIEQFDTPSMLMTRMRIVPLDMIVMDYKLAGTTAAQLVLNLRRNLEQRQFTTLVLTSSVSAEIKLACKFARIDEVIIKPMSPVFLKERVLWHLQAHRFGNESTGERGAANIFFAQRHKNDDHPEQTANWSGNVVPLFKNGQPPHHSPTPPHSPNQPQLF